MSTKPIWAQFELGYVTIELTTPFIVGDSDGDQLFDDVFVTDANGLPCIPGESLAGVLRHALAGGADPEKDDTCRKVFGYQDRDEGESSRVRISYAHAHNQQNQPVPFRGASADDPVLGALRSGVGRDHVRIGMTGAVEGAGKFDERLVPAGARFTFEIAVSHQSPYDLKQLVAVLAQPELRIGGRSRRGIGKFQVVRLANASFDLTQKEDLKRLSQLPVALEKAALSKLLAESKIPEAKTGRGWLRGTLTLKPKGTWVIGGGIPTGEEPKKGKDTESEQPWDRVPLSERRIRWDKGKGWVESEQQALFLVPGSAIKGPLRHRTAFHARRLRQEWLKPGQDYKTTPEEALLFGEVRSKEQGRPGLVYINDVYLQQKPKYETQQHVSLDRFTQGPMDHLLFDEVSLGQTTLTIELSIREPESTEQSQRALEALDQALCDLMEGRISVGAGRGHGRFEGEIRWHDGRTSLAKREVLRG